VRFTCGGAGDDSNVCEMTRPCRRLSEYRMIFMSRGCMQIAVYVRALLRRDGEGMERCIYYGWIGVGAMAAAVYFISA
jgi:hypothetical protein